MGTSIVIFGATGDLTHRKLIPALFRLFQQERLAEGTHIVGYARRPYDDATFREALREALAEAAEGEDAFDAEAWGRFSALLHYQRGDLNTERDFQALHDALHRLEDGPADRLYYLATAPEFYEPVVEHLNRLGLSHEDEGWRRLVVEKPFGYDAGSADALNRTLAAGFEERQIYRIDHYLGKETVQNMLFLRFANAIFEPIWNRNYVDHVQITVAESVDVGTRGGYYDKAGVLRDMFQNHLLQLLTLTAMEPPAAFTADALRDEKVKVLGALRPPHPVDTVRGQYAGYRDAQGVGPRSETATFAALRLFIDNWRWQDVPFYLRSGKALTRKTSEILVQFRRPPHLLFNLPQGEALMPNALSICIQPDEGIHLTFQTKAPGSASQIQPVDMTFHYRDRFKEALPEAYERLLLDALLGDQTLFTRKDEIGLQWKLIDMLHYCWAMPGSRPLAAYPPGAWGPPEADALLAADGRAWRLGCGNDEC
jgi:glucose-6-phosphate 1-dehydrogenase